jgi:hypothetical protein
MTQNPNGWGQPPARQHTGYAEGPGVASGGPYNQPYPMQSQGQFQGPGTNMAPAGGEPEQFAGAAAVPAGGGETIKIHQLLGRLILARPTSAPAMAPGFNGGEAKLQMTIELIVFDGPPIPGMVDGRNGQVTKPFAAGPKTPPFYVATVYVTHELLLKQLEPSVPSRSFVLNRVGQGQAKGQNSPPFILLDASPADHELARSVIGPKIAEGFNAIKAASAPEPEQPFAHAGAYQPQMAPANPSWAPPIHAPQDPPAQWQPPAQPQPYQQPSPQQYPAQGPAGAPWAQPQQAGPPPWAQ